MKLWVFLWCNASFVTLRCFNGTTFLFYFGFKSCWAQILCKRICFKSLTHSLSCSGVSISVTCLLKKLSTCNDAVFKQGYHGKLSRCKPNSFDYCLVLFKLLLKAIINIYWVPTQLDFWIVSLTSIDITTGVIPLILVIRNFHQLKKLLIGKQFLPVSTLKSFFNNDHFLHYHGVYVWCRVIM